MASLRFISASRTLLVALGLGVSAHAQTPAPDLFAAKMDSIRAAEAKELVRVRGPATVTIDPQTHTATIHLYNPQADTAIVVVSLSFAPPQRVRPMLADALLSEDSVTQDSMARETQRTDSLATLWSLESWIQEPLPVDLWLAPHQTIQLTLHAQVPPTLAAGTYSAHVLIRTKYYVPITFPDLPFFGGVIHAVDPHVIVDRDERFSPTAAVQLVYPHSAETVSP